jgi:organic hydroperoxide reductase OsmC/OhrA
MSDASAVDPEEAFVASLSSCHMLWFLSIAAKRKFTIDRYRDLAVGMMEKNSDGKTCMTTVTLNPEVDFSGDVLPTPEQIHEMHHEAHDECFIANSVMTDVRCVPVIAIAEQDPLVLVLRTRKRTVLVLDGSSSIAASRWSDTPNRRAATSFPS